jgi:dipeptidyl aminopeptidase/acylaminoacyl peptidase
LSGLLAGRRTIGRSLDEEVVLSTRRLSLAAAAAAAVAAATAPLAAASFHGANGRIAFASNRSGQTEIVLADADGSHRTPLGASGTSPRFSPDGSRIAFASTRDGNSEIYVMNADGSGQTRLTNYPGYDSRPQWTADGRIVFTRILSNGNWEIFRMNADGSAQTNLTQSDDMEWGQAASPHGDKIVFTREDDGIGHLYTMNLNGGDLRRVTGTGAYDSYPNWSPAGNDIVFTRDTADGSGSDLWVVHADGSGERQLTHQSGSGYVYAPAWSPDGTKIVYTQCAVGAANPCALHVVNADGSGDSDISTPRLPFVDTFDGPALDSFWGNTFLSGQGVTTGLANGELEVLVPSTATLDPTLGYITTGVGAQCAVGGDFDAQVDYRLIDWGSPAGVNLGFNVFSADYSESHGMFVHDDGFGTGVSTGFPGPLNTFVFDSARTGTLRLQRVGTTLTASRMTGSGWSPLQSIEMSAAPQVANLNVFSNAPTGSHPDARVAFDNFKLTGGGLSCPSWWNDSQPDWQPAG